MYIGKTRNPIVVILLSIVTCGIYMFYWYYTVMEDLNKASGEEKINSVLFLILGILCFPVMWYVLYKIDKGLAELSAREGIPYKENFILWLVLSLLAGVGTIIASYQITVAFNDIWARRGGGAPPPVYGQTPPVA